MGVGRDSSSLLHYLTELARQEERAKVEVLRRVLSDLVAALSVDPAEIKGGVEQRWLAADRTRCLNEVVRVLNVSSAGARLVAEILAARALYTALLDHERVESFQGAVREALATYAGALNADAELRGGTEHRRRGGCPPALACRTSGCHPPPALIE